MLLLCAVLATPFLSFKKIEHRKREISQLNFLTGNIIKKQRILGYNKDIMFQYGPKIQYKVQGRLKQYSYSPSLAYSIPAQVSTEPAFRALFDSGTEHCSQQENNI